MPVPALVIAPVPLMIPAKLELKLLVLPIVSVLAPKVTAPVPELLSAPIVCDAPRANVAPVETVTFAKEPSAVALFEFNVPPVMSTRVPSIRLVAAEVSVRLPGAPLFVMVRAVPLSFNAPSVRFAVVGLKVGLPVSVVVPAKLKA